MSSLKETRLETVLDIGIKAKVTYVEPKSKSIIAEWVSIGDEVEIKVSMPQYKARPSTYIIIRTQKMLDKFGKPLVKTLYEPRDIQTFNRIVKLIPLTLWEQNRIPI